MLLSQPIHLLTTLLKRKRETKCIWKRPPSSPHTPKILPKNNVSKIFSNVCIHYIVFQQQRNKNIQESEFEH